MLAKEIIDRITRQLEGQYGEREARNVVMLLLEDNYRIIREDLLLNKEVHLDEKKLSADIGRLIANAPVQHVTGVADFFGRKFLISKDTLIPRPETEELVRLILDETSRSNERILDIGVGSGCIAITLALEADARVIGTDVSADALEMARKNADHFNVKLELIENDVLTDKPLVDRVDIVVSNPPYVPVREREEMNANVVNYEPAQALFVPNDDPLIFYRRIAHVGKSVLNPGGKLYCEIHEDYGLRAKSLIENLRYINVRIYPDMQGKDRMLSAMTSSDIGNQNSQIGL